MNIDIVYMVCNDLSDFEAMKATMNDADCRVRMRRFESFAEMKCLVDSGSVVPDLIILGIGLIESERDKVREKLETDAILKEVPVIFYLDGCNTMRGPVKKDMPNR